MRSRSLAGEVGKTLLSLSAWLLAFGGIVTLIAAFVSGNLWLGVAGIAAILVSQSVHAVTRKQFARDLEMWAAEAVRGMGPVPPAAVRIWLAKRAMANGAGGDFIGAFQYACQVWAIEQVDASRGNAR